MLIFPNASNACPPQPAISQDVGNALVEGSDSLPFLDLALLLDKLTYRGLLVGTANLTGSATGNAYYDGADPILAGDLFVITTTGSLTVNGGTVSVSAGNVIFVEQDVAKSAIASADITILNPNLYTRDGTLTGARAVTLGGFTLSFVGSAFSVNVAPTGRLGLGVSPLVHFHNNGGTILGAQLVVGDFPTGGVIGTAAATVDIKTIFSIAQTTAGQALTLPAPTSATLGHLAMVTNRGSASFTMYGVTIAPGTFAQFLYDTTAWRPHA